MTQLPFSGEQAIALEELEQYINQQALLVSVESGASYSIKSQTRNFLTSDDKPDIPIPGSAASEQPLFEPLKHLLSRFSQSRNQHDSIFAPTGICSGG